MGSFWWLLLALQTPASPPAKPADKPEAPEPNRRVELNLLGQADLQSGEGRRNENVQFNLVDNNLLKELNVRLGVTATLVTEFRPERGYFGAEFGNAPSAPLHLAPQASKGSHGSLRWLHQNSVSSARAFFQVGDVQPARENDYGLSAALPARRVHLSFDAGRQQIRGQVNGNVLVPKPDERSPLATDAAIGRRVQQFLDAYPAALPNRTDINPRALNTNAPQRIDNSTATLRADAAEVARGRLAAQYQFTLQNVDAFQLVAGQNPDTTTRNHRARLGWNRAFSASTVLDLSAGFDRIGSLLRPEPNAVGPMVSPSGLTTLGPEGIIPIDRSLNLFRYAAQARHTRGHHNLTAGVHLLRRQLNGQETDAHRGYFSFANDFGRDGITNLRLGTPAQYIISIGDIHRGFRNWDFQAYLGDTWRARPALTLNYGVRWAPVSRPYEVHHRNAIPYDADLNNLAPTAGLAWRLPRNAGVLRLAGSAQFGEIFPVTFQQVRLSPPGSVKFMVPAPQLLDPLGGLTQGGLSPDVKGNLYLLDPELAAPYAWQYNAAWEREIAAGVRVQAGYVGSRQHKLLSMWYLNRGRVVPGIPQISATLNQRRPDQSHADIRYVVNGSRGYYDAARLALVLPRRRGLSLDAAYWFSKALDLGSAYTNTAYDADTRLARSQTEGETHRDMKGRSSFDQPHAFLTRASYDLPSRALRGWTFAAVGLWKQGTPFTVVAGSDGPGYGNVDGNGNDRPNLLDPSILGRAIGHPDSAPRLLPRAAFAFIDPTAAKGNLGRNTFRKGGIANVNASLARAFALRHDLRLTLRAESINLFNTPQFADPGFELANPNFGQITNTLNDGRAFRFALLLAW